MHGSGRCEWPDGSAYEGQYVNDLKVGLSCGVPSPKDGEGSFFWADGPEPHLIS